MAFEFSVGEQPTDPIVLTVLDADGDPQDLSGYTDVDFEGTGLPAGTTSVVSAVEGKVGYTMSAPFDTAGVISVRIRMADATGVDYSGYVDLTVSDSTVSTGTLLLTSAEAEEITNTPVSAENVAQAQATIGLYVNRDLSDSAVLSGIGTRDTAVLKQAIAWQAVAQRQPSLSAGVPAGAKSVTTGRVSIDYGDSGAPDGVEIAPLARLALSRLSWMGSRSVSLIGHSGRRSRFSPLVSDNHQWSDIF